MKILAAILVLFFSTQLNAQSNINISNAPFFEGEPYLVIDPANSQNLVAAWMGFTVGQAITIKTSTSNDGGLNWTLASPLAHEQAGNTSADVSMGYDSNGNLFICYIDFENTNFSYGKIMVRKSINNGSNWGPAVEAMNITDCPDQLCIDRPWMVIDNNDRIFITSMNASQPSIVIAPYHPYSAVSTDGGSTFSNPIELDNFNTYAGSLIKQPIPSPTIGSDGTFYAAYPSYVVSQNFSAQMFLVKSTTGGSSYTYSTIYVGNSSVTDPFSKKAYKLVADPTLPNHLAFITLNNINGDADVFYSETTNGTTWSGLERVNQDPVANGKMQDLIWAEYNERGDLAVCWRDRRNASASGYQTETEIYATVRYKDSVDFENDFAISSQQVSHDAVLEGAGNDFMNLKFIGDTIYAVWGDVRTGTVNIFLNKTNIIDGISSIFTISEESEIIQIYPNPAQNKINILNFEEVDDAQLITSNGEIIQSIEEESVDISLLAKGNYFVTYNYKGKRFSSKFVKN